MSTDAKKSAAPKLPYFPPQLRRLGSVAELTLTPGTVDQVEPMFNQVPKSKP